MELGLEGMCWVYSFSQEDKKERNEKLTVFQREVNFWQGLLSGYMWIGLWPFNLLLDLNTSGVVPALALIILYGQPLLKQHRFGLLGATAPLAFETEAYFPLLGHNSLDQPAIKAGSLN